MKMLSRLALVTAVLLAPTFNSEAQILNVQFQAKGTALTGTQTAGVVPMDNYNVVSGSTGTYTSLFDSDGNATSVVLALNTSDYYSSGTGNSTPDKTLLSGKVGPAYNSSATITLSNLAAGTYDLILYTVDDTAGQVATFNVGSLSYSIADQLGSDFDGTFIQGTNTVADSTAAMGDVANYVRFDNLVVTAGGSITLTSTQLIPSGVGAGDFNGLQLIQVAAVPEPSETMLLLGGLGILAVIFRFRKSGKST